MANMVGSVFNVYPVADSFFITAVNEQNQAQTSISLLFSASLGLGILEGIGIGVIISFCIVIHHSSYPNIVILGRLPDTDHYRDLERHPEGLTQTNMIIVRIDASLYFPIFLIGNKSSKNWKLKTVRIWTM
ncbi:hypothetical protein [Fodinibius halophilus]|uniref:Uncharacterized protein n=1 Tax=Fodinibius halophilus TaxID=1736908 RepID=A0A6M1TEX4_9BACT|nr:hypothetical protein [Fodinibius halophilus]NGP87160.1 hypothetical protein [Fodinibius halophilus]